MGEEGPKPASKKPEGEKTKEGGLQDVREEAHSGAGNHRWVQGLMKGDICKKYFENIDGVLTCSALKLSMMI